jgi:hypothetical protein
LEHERELREKLLAAEASAAVLVGKPELKAARRTVEKKITMWVNSISGTQQQVREKALQLIEVRVWCRNRPCVGVCSTLLWCDVGGGEWGAT